MTEESLADYVTRLEQENKILKSNTNVLNDYIIKNEQLKTNIDSLVKINESLKQENKELGRKAFLAEQNVRTTSATFCEKDNKINELEQENRELKAYKDVNEDFKKAWDELNRKYTEVLKLAKENADSNEYCLQELEKENKKLKEEKQAIKSYLGIESKTILERLEELDEWKHNDKLLLWKYRSSLEEIREIAEKYKNMEGCRIPLGAIEMQINECIGTEAKKKGESPVTFKP